jgi:hypothetical protein
MIIILLILAVMFGPPILFLSMGIRRRKINPDSAKMFYILTVVYLIVAGGVCYSLLSSFG